MNGPLPPAGPPLIESAPGTQQPSGRGPFLGRAYSPGHDRSGAGSGSAEGRQPAEREGSVHVLPPLGAEYSSQRAAGAEGGRLRFPLRSGPDGAAGTDGGRRGASAVPRVPPGPARRAPRRGGPAPLCAPRTAAAPAAQVSAPRGSPGRGRSPRGGAERLRCSSCGRAGCAAP